MNAAQRRMAVQVWQRGSGPAPPGFVVLCTGCSRCAVEGHRPRPTTEAGWAAWDEELAALRASSKR